MALARVFMTLEKPLGITLCLAHLNHCLRGAEADRDEAFVRTFAHAHNLDLAVARADVAALAKDQGLSVEEAGREARYDFFARTARDKGCTRIALGHHWDDHVEQVLMNLIRGTGPTGLRGIPPKRDPFIIRPLIKVSKSEILGFLKEIGQPHVVDISNDDIVFLRNRVRHSLVPLLETQFNPEIKTGLDRLSRIMAREDDFLETTANDALDVLTAETGDQHLSLSIEGLHTHHPAISSRIIRSALLRVKQDLKRITLGHIEDILEFAQQSEPGKHLDLPGRIRVYREREVLIFKKEEVPLRELGRREKKR